MSDTPHDAETLHRLFGADLAETFATMTTVEQMLQPVSMDLELTRAGADKLLKARLALARGEDPVAAVKVLLSVLVDPIVATVAQVLANRERPTDG